MRNEFPLICDFFDIPGNCGANKIDDDYTTIIETIKDESNQIAPNPAPKAEEKEESIEPAEKK